MAVMLETSLGEMVFDLHTDLCPKVAHVALEPLSMPILPRVLPAQSLGTFCMYLPLRIKMHEKEGKQVGPGDMDIP